jgi:hypothetical protein
VIEPPFPKVGDPITITILSSIDAITLNWGYEYGALDKDKKQSTFYISSLRDEDLTNSTITPISGLHCDKLQPCYEASYTRSFPGLDAWMIQFEADWLPGVKFSTLVKVPVRRYPAFDIMGVDTGTAEDHQWYENGAYEVSNYGWASTPDSSGSYYNPDYHKEYRTATYLEFLKRAENIGANHLSMQIQYYVTNVDTEDHANATPYVIFEMPNRTMPMEILEERVRTAYAEGFRKFLFEPSINETRKRHQGEDDVVLYPLTKAEGKRVKDAGCRDSLDYYTASVTGRNGSVCEYKDPNGDDVSDFNAVKRSGCSDGDDGLSYDEFRKFISGDIYVPLPRTMVNSAICEMPYTNPFEETAKIAANPNDIFSSCTTQEELGLYTPHRCIKPA